MGFRQRLGRALRFVGVAIVLFLGLIVAALAAAGARWVVEALGVPHRDGRFVAWAVLVAIESAELVLWRRARRRAHVTRLAAARELRRSDPGRYWSLLGGGQALLPEEKRDAFVGRKLLAEQTLSAARARAQRSDWVASSPAEAASVERLTREHRDATVVRSIDGGGAEVIGTTDWVGYRYRVDPDGTTTLLETDPSKVRRGRAMEFAFAAGIVVFLGGIVVAVVLDHTVGHAGWGIALGFAGGLVGFVGQTGLVDPRDFADSDLHWTIVGDGWQEVD